MSEKVRSILLSRYNSVTHSAYELVFCGIRNKIHFHTIRHSFASLLVQRGVSLYVVKELLEHEEL